MNAPSLNIVGDTNDSRGGRSLLDADPGPAILIALLVAITAVRIIALAVSNAELFFDEAQYWAWGQEPAFGYYTKPPLIAWIIGATTSLCGDTPFCVRLPSPLMHFATSLAIYALATKLHSRRVAFWAALIYALMPGTSISATLMSTDVPLLLFWAIGLLAIVHHVERPSLPAGVALGVAVGLGLNAKYAMVYLPLCYAVYAVVSPQARATLKHPGTWAALAIALLLIAPNLIWNAGAPVRDLRAHPRQRELEWPLPEHPRPAGLPRHAGRHCRPGAFRCIPARGRSDACGASAATSGVFCSPCRCRFSC